jgi:hypothetical protein
MTLRDYPMTTEANIVMDIVDDMKTPRGEYLSMHYASLLVNAYLVV